MSDQTPVYATAALIFGVVALQMLRRRFDPFAPIWLFLVGYAHVYVIQAISFRDYVLRIRGVEVVTESNVRALWALAWFLVVYFWGPGRWVARRLPPAPMRWSGTAIAGLTPILIAWGLFGAIHLLRGGGGEGDSAEVTLLRQFPIMMLIAGILLIVTGRAGGGPASTLAGAAIVVVYMLIWMFNGKRSHSVIAVLTSVCAYYTSRGRRPSMPMLALTGFVAALALSIAIGWRGNERYERSAAGFVEFLGDFQLESILVNASLKDRHADAVELPPELASRETEEYPGFVMMVDTVPAKAEYDYGLNYLRVVSTWIPRIVWPDKPIFGRDRWIAAWIAGSEFPRDETFTGPAIGILGAAQLNGGAFGTFLVMAVVATVLRSGYEYFRRHERAPWAQAWWALTYYNAWLMTVNDDPASWFYYIYGHTTLPPIAFLWLLNHLAGGSTDGAAAPDHTEVVTR